MTPYYDLKQQEKNNGVFGGWAGWGGHKHFCHISGGGGSSMFFQRDWGGRQNFCLPHENVTVPRPPPHLVINDSSLTLKSVQAIVSKSVATQVEYIQCIINAYKQNEDQNKINTETIC